MRKIVPIIGIFVLLLAMLIGAVDSSMLSSNSPNDNIWIANVDNASIGFNITFSDPEEGAAHDYGVDCSLHVTNTTITNLANFVSGDYKVGSLLLANDSFGLMYYNRTFPNNNTKYYWAITCENTSRPGTQMGVTSLKNFYIDLVHPTIVNGTTTGFTTTTLQNTDSISMVVTYSDNMNVSGFPGNCSIINETSNETWTTLTAFNGQTVNLTLTVPEGNWNFSLQCIDYAGNVNTTTNTDLDYDVRVDTTSPVIVYNSGNPADAVRITSNNVTLYFNFTELNLDDIVLRWNSQATNTSIGSGNCSSTSIGYENCTYNVAGLGNLNSITYDIVVNDTVANSGSSTERTISVDLITGALVTPLNLTFSAGTATFFTDFKETITNNCWITYWNRTATVNNGNVTGIIEGTISENNVTYHNCTGTFTGSSINADGKFTYRYDINDSTGTSVNSSNFNGVKKTLVAGWNTITYVDVTKNISLVCDEISGCTQASVYNATNEFQTYSSSTPTVNHDIDIDPGDGLLVYVSSATSILMNKYLPTAAAAAANFTISSTDWKLMGLLNPANSSSVLNAINYDGSATNVTFTSYFDTTSENQWTCSRAASICSRISGTGTNISLQLGTSIWLLGNTNSTINRSTLTGGVSE